MGSMWRSGLYDMSAWNSSQVEDVDLEFEEMLGKDENYLAWQRKMEFGMDDVKLVV